jgi:muconolactone D-isomerase
MNSSRTREDEHVVFCKRANRSEELVIRRNLELWKKETEAAIDAKGTGKIVNLWKVAGQRRALAVVDVESHDEMDQIFMGALPMAHYLEFEQILPIREYERFAADVKKRWKA